MMNEQQLIDEGWGPVEVSMILVLRQVRIEKPPLYRKFKKIKAVGETEWPDDYGDPLMERVQNVLGIRMTEYTGGYKLDGQPCSSEKLIKLSGVTPYNIS